MPNMRKASLYLLAVLAVFAFCLFMYSSSNTKAGQFKISFLSVGQGDSIYIEAPNGRQMVIDGGPTGSISKAIKSEMPEGDTSIDVLVLTHPDADHYAGFVEFLKTYSVGTVIESGKTSNAKTYQQFESLIAEKNIPKVIARKGTKVILDDIDNVTYTVLFPDRDVSGLPTNDASIVGRLVYNNVSVMLTGDAPIATEKFILGNSKPEDIKSNILKVGHHGSRTSTSSVFITAVDPEIAIISAGKNNRYDHPHQEVVDRLKDNGIETLITKDEGTVTFISDGLTLKQVTKK